MKRITRAKAIRLKCLDCCCGQIVEVRECQIKTCALWFYRMGYEVDAHGNRITKNDIKKHELASNFII